MRIRNMRIFTVFFIILVVLASYCLGLLRTYVFKPPVPPAKAAEPFSGDRHGHFTDRLKRS